MAKAIMCHRCVSANDERIASKDCMWAFDVSVIL
jgi:hypothetical protein